jgi:hypothetical protein
MAAASPGRHKRMFLHMGCGTVIRLNAVHTIGSGKTIFFANRIGAMEYPTVSVKLVVTTDTTSYRKKITEHFYINEKL